jgi:ABC-type transport system involved in cytochrome c biogenesis permease subunit
VICGFAASWAAGRYLPLSAGTRTIVLTVGLSSLAALLFPREEESGDA